MSLPFANARPANPAHEISKEAVYDSPSPWGEGRMRESVNYYLDATDCALVSTSNVVRGMIAEECFFTFISLANHSSDKKPPALTASQSNPASTVASRSLSGLNSASRVLNVRQDGCYARPHPDFSPGGKEQPESVSCLANARPANPAARDFRRGAGNSPSPWGEGRDEGGREHYLDSAGCLLGWLQMLSRE